MEKDYSPRDFRRISDKLYQDFKTAFQLLKEMGAAVPAYYCPTEKFDLEYSVKRDR